MKRKKNVDKNICLIMTMQPRYHYRFRFEVTNYNFSKIIEDSIAFLDKLDSKKIKKIVRFYMNDNYGWEVKKRFEDSRVSYIEDRTQKKFLDLIEDIYICVFDHLGTTYLESLTLNKPTVIFIDKNFYKFRTSAQPFFDILEKVKILHYSAESAAKHIEKIYEDVNKWWQCPKVQIVRKKFVDQLARTSKKWVQEWIREFENVLVK